MKSAPKNLRHLAPSFKNPPPVSVNKKAQKKKQRIFINAMKNAR